MLTITVCIVSRILTAEIKDTVPNAKQAGMEVLLGISCRNEDDRSDLRRFALENECLSLDLEFDERLSQSYNQLFRNISEGYIVRLDEDEYLPLDQALNLASWLRSTSPNTIGRLQSRMPKVSDDAIIYLESRIVRVWPASRQLGYEGPLLETFEQRPNIFPCDNNEAVLGQCFFLKRTANDQLYSQGICEYLKSLEKALFADPSNNFYLFTRALAYEKLGHPDANRALADCFQALSNLDILKSIPLETEGIITLGLTSAPERLANSNNSYIAEQIGLRLFNRSVPVLLALKDVRVSRSDYEGALYYLNRAIKLIASDEFIGDQPVWVGVEESLKAEFQSLRKRIKPL